MPRTKGSRNKKLIVGQQVPTSNFKSMEVITTKTQLHKVAFSKSDIENLVKDKARELAGYKMHQFEKEELVYDKKGNAFITLTNPIMKDNAKSEFAPKSIINEIKNEFGGK